MKPMEFSALEAMLHKCIYGLEDEDQPYNIITGIAAMSHLTDLTGISLKLVWHGL